MVQLIWSELAVGELQEIFEYISKDSKIYAWKANKENQKVNHQVKTSKYIGKVVEELDVPTIREIIEGNYSIIYKVLNDNEVVILTIHHTARNLTKRRIE